MGSVQPDRHHHPPSEKVEDEVPNTKSARKRLRQNERRRQRNKAARSRLKTAVKKVRAATKPEEAVVLYRRAAELLDRAAGKDMIHRNQANRSKSRLAAHVKRLGGDISG